MKLTGIIIAKNEEKMIEDSIKSLKFCDEILLVDNGSQDKTVDIAKQLGARIISAKTNDFSKLRNEGIRNVRSDWVLYIDADERVSDELSEEIKKTIKNPKNFSAFKIKRKNFYYGKVEWPKNEELERLFLRKDFSGWFGKLHESPKFKGEIGTMSGFVYHYTHRNLTQMLDKTIEWSEIEADLRFTNNHPKMSWWRFPRVMISAFLDSYFKQEGYRAGAAGLVEGIYQSYSSFITYARLWEKQQGFKDDN